MQERRRPSHLTQASVHHTPTVTSLLLHLDTWRAARRSCSAFAAVVDSEASWPPSRTPATSLLRTAPSWAAKAPASAPAVDELIPSLFRLHDQRAACQANHTSWTRAARSALSCAWIQGPKCPVSRGFQDRGMPATSFLGSSKEAEVAVVRNP